MLVKGNSFVCRWYSGGRYDPKVTRSTLGVVTFFSYHNIKCTYTLGTGVVELAL